MCKEIINIKKNYLCYIKILIVNLELFVVDSNT